MDSWFKQGAYPDTFTGPVRRHHRMDAKETMSGPLRIFQQANLLAKAAGFGLTEGCPESTSESMQALGIGEQMKDDLTSRLVRRMEQIRYLF